MVKFYCFSCKNRFDVPAYQPDMEVICPECEEPIEIPNRHCGGCIHSAIFPQDGTVICTLVSKKTKLLTVPYNAGACEGSGEEPCPHYIGIDTSREELHEKFSDLHDELNKPIEGLDSALVNDQVEDMEGVEDTDSLYDDAIGSANDVISETGDKIIDDYNTQDETISKKADVEARMEKFADFAKPKDKKDEDEED